MEEQSSRRLRLGANLTIAAGAMPFFVGLTTLGFLWLSYAHPDDSWRASMPPGSRSSFSLSGIRAFNNDLGQEIVAAKHVHYSILIAVGIIIMALAQFGLKQKQRWSWYLLIVTIILVGWNDGFTTLFFGQPPVPFVPAGLATIGLFLARSEIFRPRVLG